MPSINFKSRSIVMAKGRNIYQTEENLIKYGKERKESLCQKIKEKEDKENTAHWFRPTLISNRSFNRKNGGEEQRSNIYNKLYNKGKQRSKILISVFFQNHFCIFYY